jgi:hypothetical protein
VAPENATDATDATELPVFHADNGSIRAVIAVAICSTRSYSYALIAQARKIQACLSGYPAGVIILVGDKSPQLAKAHAFYKKLLGSGWSIELWPGQYEDGLENYKNPAQLIIAQMRSVAFDRARQLNVDYCWSLDSDVLPHPNSLKMMIGSLDLFEGVYDISTCPYPSQGGGPFLGGRGTPERPILPNFYDDEREIPAELQKKIAKHHEILKKFHPNRPDQKWFDGRKALDKEVQQCKVIGDTFFCNSQSGLQPFMGKVKERIEGHFPKSSKVPKELLKKIDQDFKFYSPKGFRRRGWMDAAYPGIGWGAIVPSDWCGFGCTLMNRKALALAQFEGYEGAGTEDLYVVWKKWYRSGLKINVIPHVPCDHVIRDRQNPKKFILCQAHHESKDPERSGHLRVEYRPWYESKAGEKYHQ